MKVFKFGGASIKDAPGVMNVANILHGVGVRNKVLIVVSAMGKTTNALEKLLDMYFAKSDYEQQWRLIYDYHLDIAKQLFAAQHPVFEELDRLFLHLRRTLDHHSRPENYHESYDQVVAYGELISSLLLSHYLNQIGIPHQWVDARQYIRTDTTWRRAQVDWAWTEHLIQKDLRSRLENTLILTQGFIGGTTGGRTTTLGREGSDYSAALFAAALRAESVTVWKDVPGVMNADPRFYAFAQPFTHLSYRQAAEMTFYGASVIHPSTIRPLAQHAIPLWVRSFLDPAGAGTRIDAEESPLSVPCVVHKPNQCLLTFTVRDLSFISEERVSYVLDACHRMHVKINMMQSSAVSLSICFDYRKDHLDMLMHLLQDDFAITYNTGLLLITILSYEEGLIEQIIGDREVFLRQQTRRHVRLLVAQG